MSDVEMSDVEMSAAEMSTLSTSAPLGVQAYVPLSTSAPLGVQNLHVERSRDALGVQYAAHRAKPRCGISPIPHIPSPLKTLPKFDYADFSLKTGILPGIHVSKKHHQIPFVGIQSSI